MEENIKLIHGDCLEELSKIDLSSCIIVSDPPFNIGYRYNTYKDNKSEKEYIDWLAQVFRGNRHVMIHYPEMMIKHAININVAPEKVVPWVYNSNTARQHRQIAFFGIKPNFNQVRQPYKNPTDKRILKRISEGKTGAKLYDWWNVNQVKNVNKDKTEHPCQMPLEVMTNIIGILPKNYTIVDPFMGSGTTGVACKKLGYNFIGIEMDEKYFDISKDRINQTQQNPPI